MTRRITLTLPEDLILRLNYLADYYDAPVLDVIHELITHGVTFCEDAIQCEACAQIEWLAHIEPAGNA